MTERIRLRYTGGLAENGRLHFYEYSRSQYATARLIATVEHFRRTGETPQKISSKSYVDIFVETPERGSFIETIEVAVETGVATFVSAQLSSVLSLVWDSIIFRRTETESDIVEIARIRLAEETERTKQSELETERIRELRQIVESGAATTQQALKLIEDAMRSPSTALGRAGIDQRRLLDAEEQLIGEGVREATLAADRSELEKIDPTRLAKLTSRVRSIVPDMGLPLKRSAEKLEIYQDSSREPIVVLDEKSISLLSSRTVDENIVKIFGRVKSYDRDRRIGKISSSQLDRVLNFIVAPQSELILLPLVLKAMTVNEVVIDCQQIIDKSGLPTSSILVDINFV